MNKENCKYMYVVSDLKRVGPTNQTLNIVSNLKVKDNSLVVTLFEEPTDSMINEYKEKGIDVHSLNLNRITFFLTASMIIRRLIRKYNIKIVHSYGVKPDCVCQRAIKGTNAIHLITLRNYPKEDINTRMSPLKARIALHNHLKTLKKASYIVACSETIKRKMKNDYPNMNIISIQNGVDVEKFKKISIKEKNILREKFNINKDVKIYISTSSFIPRKRIEETIEAFKKLEEKDKMLILLGDGIEFDRIFNKYKSLKDVKFIGKTDKIVEYLQLSDVFISSSQSEGLPNGVIEAIACGLPIVVSDISQHKEIIEQVKNAGILYELGNIEDFSMKMSIGLKYENTGCNISNSKLTMKSMSNKYVEYYERILKNE